MQEVSGRSRVEGVRRCCCVFARTRRPRRPRRGAAARSARIQAARVAHQTHRASARTARIVPNLASDARSFGVADARTASAVPMLVRVAVGDVGTVADALAEGRVPSACRAHCVQGTEALTVDVVPLEGGCAVAVRTLRGALARVWVEDVARRSRSADGLLETGALAADIVPNLVRGTGNHVLALRDALTDRRVPSVARLVAGIGVFADALATGNVPSVAGGTDAC